MVKVLYSEKNIITTFKIDSNKTILDLSKIENNLIELFKGNLPLYKSYWIYYVLVNFLISAPLLLVTKIHIQNFIFRNTETSQSLDLNPMSL